MFNPHSLPSQFPHPFVFFHQTHSKHRKTPLSSFRFCALGHHRTERVQVHRWPHVVPFASLTELLRLVETVDLRAVSARMQATTGTAATGGSTWFNGGGEGRPRWVWSVGPGTRVARESPFLTGLKFDHCSSLESIIFQTVSET